MSSITNYPRKELHQNSFYSAIACLGSQAIEKTKDLWTRATRQIKTFYNEAMEFKPRSIEQIKLSITDLAKIQEELTKTTKIDRENFDNLQQRQIIINLPLTATLVSILATLWIGGYTPLVRDCLTPPPGNCRLVFGPMTVVIPFIILVCGAAMLDRHVKCKDEDRQKIKETNSYVESLSACKEAAEDKAFTDFAKKEYMNSELSPSEWRDLYHQFLRNQQLDKEI